jgi:hypothetical protein
VCGINDLGHTCDEYLVLPAKSGMTSGAHGCDEQWNTRDTRVYIGLHPPGG